MKPEMLNKLTTTVKRLVSRGRGSSFDERHSEHEFFSYSGEQGPLPSRVRLMYSKPLDM